MATFHAFLVGINQYATGSGVPVLRGCMNDATAMYDALRRVTGAPDENFLLLTNEQATREAIITGWRTHLRDRVRPGDVAYFHFSGHGSRARSNPDEDSGWDETLVAYDSRLEEKFDLADKELSRLIAEVEQAGAQVIVFLDCCHSGGGTRAASIVAVRKCPADERIRPASTLLANAVRAKTRSPSGWPAAEHHVLCAACRSEELANEYYAVDLGRWHGAATYFFLTLLHAYRPELTWADAQDQLSARVHAIYANQSPQVEGPSAVRLFGGVGAQVSGYLLVTAIQGDAQVKLDGGVAAGVVVGSRLALYPPGSTLEGAPLALAVVDEAALDHAWARLESAASIEIASRARILSFGYAAQSLPIACSDPTLLAAIGGASAGGPSRFLQIVTGAAQQNELAASGASLLVTVDEGRYMVCDPSGIPVIDVTLPANEAGAAAAVRALEHLAIYRNVRALRNTALDSALRSDVAVTEPMRIKASRSGRESSGQKIPLRREGGEFLAAAGHYIAFDVVNQSSRPLYVTVFQLGADYAIQPIAPPKGEGRQVTLEPGRTLSVRRKLDLPIVGQERAGVIFKVFTTTEKMSFDALSLPPLNAGPIHLTSRVRDAGPLSNLLDAVRRSGTRPIRFVDEDDVDDKWWVEQFEIKIARE